jgi:predicted RNase H-like nuclease
MRILGVDLPRHATGEGPVENTLVLLDERGRFARSETIPALPGVASTVGSWTEGELFLLGANLPLVLPAKSARMRPVERLIRRRFGFRIAAGGRSVLAGEPQGIAGETLMASLAAAGQPCLPYPDPDRRRPGMMETHPALILKGLLWEASSLSRLQEPPLLEELFRAYDPPAYRSWEMRARTGWSEQAARLDQVLMLLAPVEGYDVEPAREALLRARSRPDVERAAGLLDACLVAGTARRYTEAPETCLFLGDREQGYLVLPADSMVRRLAVSGAKEPRGRLFPSASLRERLGVDAEVRSVDLLAMPGRPQRTEARFQNRPHYEFDNVDEMLWWKHCRHLAGPMLPTDGLIELVVVLGEEPADEPPARLRLVRSRHRTLSFRFEPPAGWRKQVPTRDGKTYAFRVLRATFDTL